MSPTSFIVRSLALGASLAFGFVMVRRWRAAPARSLPSGAKRPDAGVASAPSWGEPSLVLLPLAFWDAEAELDADDRLQSARPELAFDEVDPAALEGASEWLTRATEARVVDDVDDPAEIAPDSWSIVSEASRAAAAGEPDSDTPSQRA